MVTMEFRTFMRLMAAKSADSFSLLMSLPTRTPLFSMSMAICENFEPGEAATSRTVSPDLGPRIRETRMEGRLCG